MPAILVHTEREGSTSMFLVPWDADLQEAMLMMLTATDKEYFIASSDFTDTMSAVVFINQTEYTITFSYEAEPNFIFTYKDETNQE